MTLSHRARRRLSYLLLVVWLPAYVVLAVTVVTWFERPPIWLEVPLYAFLAIAWALPFRWAFKGVGRPDPDGPPDRHLDAHLEKPRRRG